jgi:anti-sigma B factor antagonist
MQTDTRVAVDRITDASGRPVTVLRFAGDISSTSRDAVLGTYQGLSKIDHPRILLDFTKVDYLNSSGIALVIQVLLEASRSEQSVSIFGLTPHFQKVFTMVGITKYTTLYPDEATTLAAFLTEPRQ